MDAGAVIQPEDVAADDRELGLRVLAYARTVAPCLSGGVSDRVAETAIAILRPVAANVAAITRSRGLKGHSVGDWSWTYLTDAEIGSVIGPDDRAALRALCGQSGQRRHGPVGSFPPPTDYSRVFR